MNRAVSTAFIAGMCATLVTSVAHAQSNGFVGRWHWNQAQSTLPPGVTPPKDVVSDISRADERRVAWTVTVVAPDGDQRVVTFEGAGDGQARSLGDSGTTAAAKATTDSLQATVIGATGQSDVQTCTLSSGGRRMTCRGVLSDGQGHTLTYVDVYDRM